MNDLLNAPSEPVEPESVSDGQFTDRDETEDVKTAPVDVTPKENESLNDLLNAPSEPVEPESVSDGQFTDRDETGAKTGKKTANKSTPRNSEYPADDIPDFDAETGEILEGEQGALFGDLESVTQ